VTEQWRPVVGYEGLYLVSSLGRVCSIRKPGAKRMGGALKLRRMHAGYLQLHLYDRSGIRKSWRVHRLVAFAFLGSPPSPRMEVRHLNGVRDDNRAENLAWGSRSQNMHDSIRHGTHPKASPTRCPKGHPYSGENLAVDYRGRRMCRACRKARRQRSS
jgi:hypothetical protein